MKLILRKAKILPGEKERKKPKKSQEKKKVCHQHRRLQALALLFTQLLSTSPGAERQLQPMQDCMCRQSLIPLWIITEPKLRGSAVYSCHRATSQQLRSSKTGNLLTAAPSYASTGGGACGEPRD